MVEREKLFGMIENISISTYTIMAFFVSFIVLYYTFHSIEAALLISAIISILTLTYFKKRGVLLERAAKK